MDKTEHPDMGPEGKEVPNGRIGDSSSWRPPKGPELPSEPPETEIWRGAAGYPAYSVSNWGRVKRNETAVLVQPRWDDVYKAWVVPLTYMRARRQEVVARLVLRTFVGTPSMAPSLNKAGSLDPVVYLDGSPDRIWAWNLAWRHPAVVYDQMKVSTYDQAPPPPPDFPEYLNNSVVLSRYLTRIQEICLDNRKACLRMYHDWVHERETDPDLRVYTDKQFLGGAIAVQRTLGLPVGPVPFPLGMAETMEKWGPKSGKSEIQDIPHIGMKDVLASLGQSVAQAALAVSASHAGYCRSLNPWAKGNDALLTLDLDVIKYPTLPGEDWYPIPEEMGLGIRYSVSTYGRVRPDEQQHQAGRPVGRPLSLQKTASGRSFNVKGRSWAVGKLALVTFVWYRLQGVEVRGSIWPATDAELEAVRAAGSVFKVIGSSAYRDGNPDNCCIWNLTCLSFRPVGRI